MDICEVCEKLETDCDCRYCKKCGEKDLRSEMYQGLCGWCEDSSMVRSIR